MNRAMRRALLTFCGLFFLVVAPVVALYAIGYRFTPAAQDATPVGVLLLESIPKNANVFVGDEAKGRTPKAVPGLSEGLVSVRLEKDGYVPWQKNLPIIPTRATEARSIRLFAQNPALTSIASNVRVFNLAPNRRILAVLDSDSLLHFLDTQGQSVQAPIELPATPQEMLWSPDSSTVLLRTKTTYSLISLGSTLAQKELPTLTGTRSVVWDPRLPGRLLALDANDNLISYSTAASTVQVIAPDVDQFVPTTRNLITITDGNEVTWYSLLGNEDRQQTFEIAIVDILATPSGMVSLAYEDGSVAVITREGELLPVADTGYSPIGWSPDGTTLLLRAGMSELAVFNVENERATHMPLRALQTIVRLSRPINHPQWFAGGTHVVFQQDDEIIISEVDTRDRPIQVTIDSTNTGNAQVVVGEDGNVLLYVKNGEEISTLVSRPLVLPADQ